MKILELACRDKKLDLELIKDLLSSDSDSYIKNLLEAVIQKDEQKLIKIFEELRDNNYNQRDFYKDLFEFLHKDLLVNLKVFSGDAFYSIKINQFFLKEILSVDLNQETPIPFLILELKFLEIIDRSKKNTGHVSVEKSSPTVNQEEISKKKIIKKEPLNLVETDPKVFWQSLIQAFSGENFSLITLLKSCKLESLSEGIARVFVYYSFHKEQLEQNKNKELLVRAAKEIFGLDLQFDFVLQNQAALATTEPIDTDLVLAARDSLL